MEEPENNDQHSIDQEFSGKTDKSINSILYELETVVEETQSHADKRGYFAAIYQAETVHVRDGIDQGRFERPDLIESLAVRFGQRYLDAYHGYNEQLPVTRAWKIAFDATRRPTPCVLQHILMGINAHINLDLGLSVAETVPKGQLTLIEEDFDRVNILIAEMTDVVQDRIAIISPWMKWVDRLGGRIDEYLFRKLVDFSRHQAWEVAEKAQLSDGEEYEQMVDHLDSTVQTLGKTILSPAPITSTLMKVARVRERNSVAKTIDSLVTHMCVKQPA